MKEKKNWHYLDLKHPKCPVIGCETNGSATLLEPTKTHSYKCPKCGGEWGLVFYSPMDICWREIKKPTYEKKCLTNQKK